jgi:hypothetical protein
MRLWTALLRGLVVVELVPNLVPKASNPEELQTPPREKTRPLRRVFSFTGGGIGY